MPLKCKCFEPKRFIYLLLHPGQSPAFLCLYEQEAMVKIDQEVHGCDAGNDEQNYGSRKQNPSLTEYA